MGRIWALFCHLMSGREWLISSDGLTREIFILRAQVEDLASKSQLIETELERTSRQLKEAVVIAKEEVEKHKAAKEVIRSLTAQADKSRISSRFKVFNED